MSYSNNTWCPVEEKNGKDVRGESYKKFGEAMLAISPEGKPKKEQYSQWGYTTCMWSPVNFEVSTKNIKALKDYGVDLVFQDQIGSRVGLVIDFNSNSPTPNSYSDGILKSTMADSKIIPLATEDGWVHLADYEIMFTGLIWAVMDRHILSSFFMWEKYPKDAFNFYNIVGAQLQDKLSITQHNLTGHISSNSIIAAMLLNGLHIIHWYPNLNKPNNADFMNWGAVLQRNVASAYIGSSMKKYNASWVDEKDYENGYYIGEAKYGNMEIVANINLKPLKYKSVTLAPFGFYAVGRDTVSGLITGIKDVNVDSEIGFSFKKRGGKSALSIYVKENSQVIIPLEVIKSLRYQDTEIAFEKINGGIKFIAPTSNTKNRAVYFELDFE